MAACEYQLFSNWRISRRITSSEVRVLPLKMMRRTVTRGPGTTCMLTATVCSARLVVGIGFTLAKA
ncbi:hypothetical protein D3C71_1534610 [compost metagenome]